MPNLKPVGSQWLKDHYKLSKHILTHVSYIGNNADKEFTSEGHIEEVYGPKYAPGENTVFAHLEFSLKYDDLNLDFMQAIMREIPVDEMENYISQTPSGKYSRKIGFLYEFLTGNVLQLKKEIAGNYEPLLDPDKYLTGSEIRAPRWRIIDNLLGGPEFCPVVRRKKELESWTSKNIQQKISKLKSDYPAEIFRRATQYLYKKETKSSYEIEKESPSEGRVERFVALLLKAGAEPANGMLASKRLTTLQNAIVDPRFAAEGFRTYQNFVGQTLPNYQEMIHYVCPPPELVDPLMNGLQTTMNRTDGIHPGVRAALVAFGFVFVHPFEDGNGRLHRFLIHDVLAHDKIVPEDMIIPVSAHMLNHLKDYDFILEKYSKPLMQRVKYIKEDTESITITNTAEVEGYFRFPDLTDQCIYLLKTIHATLDEDMPGELLFLQRYDEAKQEIQRIVDMPDKDINWMILYLHQNGGKFPKRKREKFPKLSDDEIARMQTAYQRVYELTTPPEEDK